ncbi:hypothetical protein [Mesorhizobium erdmanii]|uniref:hypothetical protein n=1 Tax=Mesorhizobium erdmanii TaxID=1777866 RepID=UPI0004224F26|nr:hypothetical protein [Mesorhizobium erdmanii]
MARPATAAVRLLTGEREPCRVATSADKVLYGLQVIDTIQLEVGDRVLVKAQTDARQNGIYSASEGQWFRAADARTSRAMQKGTTVPIQAGGISAGMVYSFQTDGPVVGTDNITLSLYLSEDTLGDAQAAATAAAGSASAAAGSATAASVSATNAATSATAASGSAAAASSSASTAATSATNAGTSASAASGSASGAATSATNAGNSATAAAGSASAASGSATAASTSATNAATAATNAAASATAAANSVTALSYTFSTTTIDADPGSGTLRLNNATAASASAAYVDNLDAGGVAVTGILDTFDDSTNTIKGQLTLRSKASAAVSYVYNVTGAVVDGSGYRKLTLAYVSGAGSLPTAASGIWLMFDRAGDKGADGLGAGDFTGPASSVADNIVTFAGTTGKMGKDSGIKATDLIAGPASAVADNIATFNGTTGKIAKDSGVAVSSLAPKASPTFTGTPAAPTAAPGTNTTQVATTGFVKAAIDVVLGGVSAAFDTLSEIVASMVRKDADTTLTAGYFGIDVSDGVKSSGAYTPSPAGGNFRSATNNGAHTLAAPSASGSYSMVIDYTNGASAGAITISGFTKITGDAFTTTNASKFRLFISKGQGGTHLHVQALQ